jgi:tape measure domain-containing protein
MSGIDNRVTSLEFDNKQFKSAVRETLSLLANLDSKLKLDGATKGLDDVQKNVSRFSMANMGQAVDGVAHRFSALSVVAITTLATITAKVASSAAQMAKSFTVAPITDGLSEYETQLNSVQTILANTAAAGTTLKDVNATLAELNHYADQTIYNFGEMARNIGTFTAAGVDLKTATSSIKGIANLAALSGSNSQQASAAMYQLSQAISAGRVSLEDWNSVVNAGMGGTVFQRALAQTAENIGTLDKGAVKLTGSMKNVTIGGKSFRESITAKPGQESWLTSEVLTKTLSQFTGDLKDAELAAMGFDKAQIQAIQRQAKTAKAAATEVKTLSQLMGTLKEAAGSGWAQTWQLIFGDFGEAKKLFTKASNRLGGIVQASSDARNKIFGDWKKLGGRDAVIQAVANAFNAVLSVLKPIKDAFHDIFPPATGRTLYEMSVAIRDFTKGLILGSETAGKLRRTFAGFFAIFGIGFELLKQLVGVLFNVFLTATEGEGSFLDITASVGDFLVKLHDMVKNGQGVKNFFNGLQAVLRAPIKFLRILAGAIKDVFSSDVLPNSNLAARFAPLGKVGNLIAKAWAAANKVIKAALNALGPLADKLGGEFEKLGTAISDALSGADFGTFLDAINTGLFGALVLMFRKFTKGGIEGIGGGFLEKITGPFEALTGTLEAMQAQLKASTLIKIAGAIALLTVSVVALSLIDPEKLTKALVALTAMFTQLLGAMALFALATKGAGALKLTVLSAGLILLASAIDVLTLAVIGLSRLSWEELAKGLTGVIALLGALIGVSYGLNASAGGMIRAGAGLILIAGAIKILVSSVKDFSEMNWSEMTKGLAGVAAMLLALGLFSTFAQANAGGVLAGAGIVLLATGIKVLASAVKDISDMSWGELAKGMAGMAGGLTLIAAALILIPPSSILSATAVLVAATSLTILNQALSGMADMSWGEIAKGLTVLALSLGIIGAALTGMTVALPGAAAMLVISAAFVVFIPVLVTLGTLSWTTIAQGLIALAASLTVIGVAGLLLAPVVPALVGLGGAIALLGLGTAAAGAGVLAFATGLTALAAAGTAGAGAIVGIVMTLLGAVPQMVEMVGKIIVSFAKAIEAATPAVAKAAVVAISAILDAIVKLTPKILNSLGSMLVAMLSALIGYVPRLVSAGAQLIIAVLNGLVPQIPRMVKAATDVVVTFLNALSANQGRITDAGVKLIISFVNGVANAIRSNQGAMRSAGLNLATAIIDGMTGGLASGAGRVASEAAGVAKKALSAARGILGINSPSKEFEQIGKYVNEGFVKGLQGNSQQIKGAFDSMRKQLMLMTRSASSEVDALWAKLNKLKSAKKQDLAAIKATTAALQQAQRERDRSNAAARFMDTHFKDDEARLRGLATSYGQVTKRLEDARKVLADTIKTRDDYRSSVTDQYNDLPDISAETKLPDYLENLRKQIVETKAYTVMLQKLRALGLNDEAYKDLLSRGTAAMPFVSQLLDSGAAGVKEINTLDKSLADAAANLGKSASDSLYQAAVNAAQGLVNGLAAQQANIQKQMDRIADAMVKAIKAKLGIKSPSRVFHELGTFSAKGLANGLNDASVIVSRSAESMGQEAVNGLRGALDDVSRVVDKNIDANPTIRPVLDLEEVKRGVDKLNGIMPSKFDLGTTYSQAKSARVGYDAVAEQRQTDSASTDSNVHLEFTQNNYSPKAISEVDTYRNTKNQLSVAKGALGKK